MVAALALSVPIIWTAIVLAMWARAMAGYFEADE